MQFRLTFHVNYFKFLSFICHCYETYLRAYLIQTVYVFNQKVFIAKPFTLKLTKRLCKRHSFLALDIYELKKFL